MKKAKVVIEYEIAIDDVDGEELDGYKTPKNWKKLVKEEFKSDNAWGEHHPFYCAGVSMSKFKLEEVK